MPTASVTAPPVRPRSDSPPTCCSICAQGVGVGAHFGQLVGVLRHFVEIDVDGVVVALRQRRGGDQGHDADQPFHQHRAVADGANMAFARDHLGRRAGGDQGVKAGNRAAHDADEAERKDRAVENRPAAAGIKRD